jgi:hypothetical protein
MFSRLGQDKLLGQSNLIYTSFVHENMSLNITYFAFTCRRYMQMSVTSRIYLKFNMVSSSPSCS